MGFIFSSPPLFFYIWRAGVVFRDWRDREKQEIWALVARSNSPCVMIEWFCSESSNLWIDGTCVMDKARHTEGISNFATSTCSNFPTFTEILFAGSVRWQFRRRTGAQNINNQKQATVVSSLLELVQQWCRTEINIKDQAFWEQKLHLVPAFQNLFFILPKTPMNIRFCPIILCFHLGFVSSLSYSLANLC